MRGVAARGRHHVRPRPRSPPCEAEAPRRDRRPHKKGVLAPFRSASRQKACIIELPFAPSRASCGSFCLFAVFLSIRATCGIFRLFAVLLGIRFRCLLTHGRLVATFAFCSLPTRGYLWQLSPSLVPLHTAAFCQLSPFYSPFAHGPSWKPSPSCFPHTAALGSIRLSKPLHKRSLIAVFAFPHMVS